jgi:cytochrome P450
VYARLRDEDPVHWDDFFQLWALTRYAEIAALLRDPHVSSKRVTNDGRELWDAERLPEDARPAARATYRAFASLVLMYDPPEHTRFRSMISRAFTPRMIEGMRPFIFCLGAALARLEGQIAIGTLARRLPHLRLAGAATWRENFSIRGLQSLPVSFDAP